MFLHRKLIKFFLSRNGKPCSTVNSQQHDLHSLTLVQLFTWLKSLMSCLLCKLYTLLFTPGSNIFTHNVTSPVNPSRKQDHYDYTTYIYFLKGASYSTPLGEFFFSLYQESTKLLQMYIHLYCIPQ